MVQLYTSALEFDNPQQINLRLRNELNENLPIPHVNPSFGACGRFLASSCVPLQRCDVTAPPQSLLTLFPPQVCA